MTVERINPSASVLAQSTSARARNTIGLCVLAYNSEDVLPGCIDALERTLDGLPHAIVVVDNASKDQSAGVVERNYPDVKVLHNSTNTGYACGNNTGAEYLLARECDYITFVNPDVSVREETLLAMKAVLDRHDDAGCVGGPVVIQGKSYTGSFRTKPTLLEKLWLYSAARYLPGLQDWSRGWTASLEAQHFLPNITVPQPVYAVAGACIMFPAGAFAKIGGFDSNTFLYQEEFIISERLRQIGMSVYAAPAAVYDHQQGHSAQGMPVRARKSFIASEQYLLRAYYRWNPLTRAFVKLLRFADLALYVTVAKLRRAYRAVRKSSSKRPKR